MRLIIFSSNRNSNIVYTIKNNLNTVLISSLFFSISLQGQSLESQEVAFNENGDNKITANTTKVSVALTDRNSEAEMNAEKHSKVKTENIKLNKVMAKETTDWLIANFLQENAEDVLVHGDPKLVESPYGEAVHFNGLDDAFFIERMPLQSLSEFTVEMIFNPDIDGKREQRVLHIGEVFEDRMLLEIRAVDGNWYFDGFASSGENDLPLIDETKTHPLGKWYHVAFVVSPDKLSTYVNGKLELSEPFSFKPFTSGRTSIGVRLNEKSWFKGSIYEIRLTPQALSPKQFIKKK